MIEFLTLFLGLASGPQAVELAAGEGVAEVRVVLDGVEVAADAAPPWAVEVDLGPGLEPRRLEAVALDGDGRELGRATQRLNLPRPAAEARIVLVREGGRVVAAELGWESRVAARPRAVRAWLDGEPLAAADPRRVPIPAHDPSRLHLLQVELEFSHDAIAQAQAVFGGEYVDEARADLTAFPVVPRGRARDLEPAAMAGWFASGGEPLAVSAVERGGLDLVLVRGPGVGAAMRELGGTIRGGVASGGTGSPGVGGIGAVGQIANMSVATASERLRRIMAFEEGQRLRIVVPRARAQAGHELEMLAFAISPEIGPEQGGMYWALSQEVMLPGLAPRLRLADAVAVAALQAANGNRRRAVLLVLADEAADESRYATAQVRSFLAALQVPLHVWRLGPAAAGSAWGDGETIASFRDLQGAARRLADALERQRIVWLDGLHLPNAIAVAPAARVAPAVP